MEKKILVTGGAGFIGSHVIKELLLRDYKITILDDLSKQVSLSTKHKNITFIKVDLTNDAKASQYFAQHSECIHLAAKIGGIGYFHKYPATILNENNKIYATVFSNAVRYKYKKVLYVSSSMVFESAKSFPSSEASLKKIPPPITAYGFSKLIGEIYCKSYWDEYRLPYVIVRPFNAYGIKEMPGDEIGYSHVIPDLIKKVLNNQDPLELLGSGEQTRCFTHAADIARGIVMALENPAAINQDFNLGTDKETKIIDLARMISKVIYPQTPFRVQFVEGFPHDVIRRVPDVTKAEKILKWKPAIELNDVLPEIIRWIKSNL